MLKLNLEPHFTTGYIKTYVKVFKLLNYDKKFAELNFKTYFVGSG